MAIPWLPERRDVIWIDRKPQAGREMKDRRPMLVLSLQGGLNQIVALGG